VRDEKVGRELWFEYHCFESDQSCDAELWHHSQQRVRVLQVVEPGVGETAEERGDNGQPRVYKVRFTDGFEYDVFEDELLDSPEEFTRPKPLKRKQAGLVRRAMDKDKWTYQGRPFTLW